MFVRIGADRSVTVKLSGPIKSHWAKSLGLDIDQLLGDGEYKENYRLKMAKWGETMRKKDHGYFCREAIEMYNGKQLISLHDKYNYLIVFSGIW